MLGAMAMIVTAVQGETAMLFSNRRSREAGFTLIELMIVVLVVAILASIAVPMYSQHIRKAHRADAMQRIQQIALAQERFRAENPGYTNAWANLGGDPDTTSPTGIGGWFDWADPTIAAGPPATWSISVTAVGDQAKDKASGTACTTLTLDSAGAKTPAACWQ